MKLNCQHTSLNKSTVSLWDEYNIGRRRRAPQPHSSGGKRTMAGRSFETPPPPTTYDRGRRNSVKMASKLCMNDTLLLRCFLIPSNCDTFRNQLMMETYYSTAEQNVWKRYFKLGSVFHNNRCAGRHSVVTKSGAPTRTPLS